MSSDNKEKRWFWFTSPQRGTARKSPLPKVALDWLQEVLQREFTAESSLEEVVASPRQPQQLDWREEWVQRWQRLCLADRVAIYYAALGQARTSQEVYEVLSGHVVGLLDASACLLYPPGQGGPPLCALSDPQLGCALEQLVLSSPLPASGVITADDAKEDGSPYAVLLPLFTDGGAAALAHVRFGEDGTILVIERRQQRVFEPEDWMLLQAMSLQAAAALERVRLSERIAVLAHLDPVTGRPGPHRIAEVLEFAGIPAANGDPLTLVVLAVQRTAGEENAVPAVPREEMLRNIADVLQREIRSPGLVLRSADEEFLLVLPQMEETAAAAVVQRVQQRLGEAVKIRPGVAAYRPHLTSVAQLYDEANRRLDRSGLP